MNEIAPQAEETIENIKVNVEGNMENIEKQLAELKSRVEVLDKKATEPKVSMIVFSGDLDKVLASFVIATGSVAMGMDVVMFFTFWGTPVLRDKNKKVGGKDTMGKMFGTM
ncbi:MAG: NADH dehydrogenase FAD-containing subunit, partial [Desulfobacterales bacterium]|nr:NADH dehydrogenase FAD-containing subunit [Desulfobacterales bacterium]